jgi:hypothetical protein
LENLIRSLQFFLFFTCFIFFPFCISCNSVQRTTVNEQSCSLKQKVIISVYHGFYNTDKITCGVRPGRVDLTFVWPKRVDNHHNGAHRVCTQLTCAAPGRHPYPPATAAAVTGLPESWRSAVCVGDVLQQPRIQGNCKHLF